MGTLLMLVVGGRVEHARRTHERPNRTDPGERAQPAPGVEHPLVGRGRDHLHPRALRLAEREPAAVPGDQGRDVRGDHGVVAEAGIGHAHLALARAEDEPVPVGRRVGRARRTGPPPAAAAARPGRSSARASTPPGTGRGAPGAPPAIAHPTSRARGRPGPAPARSRSAGRWARRSSDRSITPARSRLRSRWARTLRGRPGAPSRRSPNRSEPRHQVAHDDGRPPFREHLGPERDGTVLPVSLHAADDPPRRLARQSEFRTSSAAAAAPMLLP